MNTQLAEKQIQKNYLLKVQVAHYIEEADKALTKAKTEEEIYRINEDLRSKLYGVCYNSPQFLGS